MPPDCDHWQMVVWWDNIWISWLSLILSKKLVQDKNAGIFPVPVPMENPRYCDGNLTGDVRKLAECLKGHVNMGSSQSSLVI